MHWTRDYEIRHLILGSCLVDVHLIFIHFFFFMFLILPLLFVEIFKILLSALLRKILRCFLRLFLLGLALASRHLDIELPIFKPLLTDDMVKLILFLRHSIKFEIL